MSRRLTRAAAAELPSGEAPDDDAHSTDTSDDERLPADQAAVWTKDSTSLSEIIEKADERARWRAPQRVEAGAQLAAANERLAALDEAAQREADAVEPIRKQLAKIERAAAREEIKRKMADAKHEADAIARRIEEISRRHDAGEATEEPRINFAPTPRAEEQEPRVASPPSTLPPPGAGGVIDAEDTRRPQRKTAGRFLSQRYDDKSFRKPGRDGWEDECHRCGLPGLLMCCSRCRHAAHPRCYGLAKAPEQEWFCADCEPSDSES